MTKKQLMRLVQKMVLSTQATINANSDASTGDAITEDEARGLVGMQLRKLVSAVIVAASGVEADQIVVEEPPVKAKKAKKVAANVDPDEDDEDEDGE